MRQVLAALHTDPLSWADWSVHWSTVIGIGGLALLYAWRAGALGRRHGPPNAVPFRRIVSFGGGLAVMFLSLNGPIHDLSDNYLMSAHMVQHLLLTLVVAPLLLYGTPGWMLRPIAAHSRIRPHARWLTRPVVAFVVTNAILVAWHMPPSYEAAMRHHAVHIVQHLTFLASAVVMWWPVLGEVPELPRPSYPLQMFYLFMLGIPMGIVGAIITMADHVLYPFYAEAERIWGLGALIDQQIGGLIMWVPGGLAFWVAMTVVFFRWARAEGAHEPANLSLA